MTPTEMADLHAQCFQVPRPWSATEFTELLADKGVFTSFVAGGLIVGRGVLDEAELLTLAVAPEKQRSGLGSLLTDRFHQIAIDRGARTAFLEVAADNTAAHSLYLKCGYSQVGRRPGYYRSKDGQRTDAIVMQRCLIAHQPA